jgi:hypothetical protein
MAERPAIWAKKGGKHQSITHWLGLVGRSLSLRSSQAFTGVFLPRIEPSAVVAFIYMRQLQRKGNLQLSLKSVHYWKLMRPK